MQSSVKPFLFGYLRLRFTAGLLAAESGRRLLGEFADEEGFALVDVYIDTDAAQPYAALASMIRCIRTSDADARGIAVAVPHLGHLGPDLATQRRVRTWILRQAQVRLIVVQA